MTPPSVAETLGSMSRLRAMDADVEHALENINVPAYVIDTSGIIRWVNPAARRVVGDVTGRQFTSVCAPEETRRARELFAQKIAGTAEVTDAQGFLVGEDGDLVHVDEEAERPLHPHLTPRQAEVLRLLERGHSTNQIARELHLSIETVRNHIRHLLRALGAHSRLEAVAIGRREHLVAS